MVNFRDLFQKTLQGIKEKMKNKTQEIINKNEIENKIKNLMFQDNMPEIGIEKIMEKSLEKIKIIPTEINAIFNEFRTNLIEFFSSNDYRNLLGKDALCVEISKCLNENAIWNVAEKHCSVHFWLSQLMNFVRDVYIKLDKQEREEIFDIVINSNNDDEIVDKLHQYLERRGEDKNPDIFFQRINELAGIVRYIKEIKKNRVVDLKEMKYFCDELSNTLEVSRNVHDVVAEKILMEKYNEFLRKIYCKDFNKFNKTEKIEAKDIEKAIINEFNHKLKLILDVTNKKLKEAVFNFKIQLENEIKAIKNSKNLKESDQYKKYKEGIRKIEWLLKDVDEIFERFENKLEDFIESKLIKFENFERKRGSQGERLVLSGNQMGALIMKDFLENLRKEREEFKKDAEKQIKILRDAYKSLERKVQNFNKNFKKDKGKEINFVEKSEKKYPEPEKDNSKFLFNYIKNKENISELFSKTMRKIQEKEKMDKEIDALNQNRQIKNKNIQKKKIIRKKSLF